MNSGSEFIAKVSMQIIISMPTYDRFTAVLVKPSVMLLGSMTAKQQVD
jgi:hypothetical protein